MIKFREFLKRHHGKIDRILLSYAFEDSPKEKSKYDEWFKQTNRSIKLNMDLMHTSQKIEDFDVLIPYLDLHVDSWSYFNAQRDSTTGEHEIFGGWCKDENVLEVSLI